MTSADNLSVTRPGRSAGAQAGFQLAALALTLAMAVLGGVVTGLLMRVPAFEQIDEENMFDDDLAFITPDDYSFKLAQIRVVGKHEEEAASATARQHLIAK